MDWTADNDASGNDTGSDESVLRSFDTPKGVRLRVENAAGEVEIETHDLPRTEVSVVALDPSADEIVRGARIVERPTVDGQEIVVEIPHTREGTLVVGPYLRRARFCEGAVRLRARGLHRLGLSGCPGQVPSGGHSHCLRCHSRRGGHRQNQVAHGERCHRGWKPSGGGGRPVRLRRCQYRHGRGRWKGLDCLG